jgi:uncharacterized membrane protein
MIKLPIAILTKVRLHMIAVILAGLAAGQVQSAETSSSVVRAVLFASPTCAHCAYVKEEVLPPLVSRYGSQLQIAIVSTATPSGNELFLSACMKHGLLHQSVPLLIVGNTAMVGDKEIPERFSGLIEKHIAAGGVDWPNIPGLAAMLALNPAFAPAGPQHTEPPAAEPTAVASAPAVANAKPPTKPDPAQTANAVEIKPAAQSTKAAPPALPLSPTPKSPTSGRTATDLAQDNSAAPPITPPSADKSSGTRAMPPSSTIKGEPSGIIDLTGGEAEMGVFDRIKRDIYGNGLAILVLAGMLLTLLVSPVIFKRSAIPATPVFRPRYDWLIPILALVGLGVAAYLSHVEVRQVEAVCGPVGDCNTVNQSEYAKLFGILPIGILGLFGFLAILTAWTLRRWGTNKISLWAAVVILGMTAFGTLFSVYLTFLEPFVIGATCLWCLSSAVIMTTLFVLALKPGRHAWSTLKQW